MWQMTQSRSNANSNYLSVNSRSSNNTANNTNIRQFGRRLSTNFFRAIRKWRTSESTEMLNIDEAVKSINNSKTHYNINEIIQCTKFSKDEIKFIYRDFKEKCPSGFLTEETLAEIYSSFFPLGDCNKYAKHLFSTMLLTREQTQQSQQQFFTEPDRVSFRDFIVSLSTISRGTVEERVTWLFNFYDTNKDGKVTKDEILSMINSIYDLMGKYVNPPIDEEAKQTHVNHVVRKFGLNTNSSIDYKDFYNIFVNDPTLMDLMMNSI